MQQPYRDVLWRGGRKHAPVTQEMAARLQPYHPERARSRLISEAKQGRAWLVLGWEEIAARWLGREPAERKVQFHSLCSFNHIMMLYK